MARSDNPFGLRALGNLSASGSQKQFGYEIADNQSGAIFKGDLVTLKDGFILQFDPSSHTAAIGVFNGCNYVDPTTGKPTFANYYPGSVNITQGKIVADVIDDPNQLFVIQADEDIERADLGKNADIVVGTGSTTTGLSANELDSSDIGTGAAKNLKLLSLYDIEDNAFANFALVVVKINEHLLGSAGVAGQ
jgi:hypothetical protein